MHLGRLELAKYSPEIGELQYLYLKESPTKGITYFGLFSEEVLTAVGGVKNYMGYWYLRACFVKPEFRGQGLQRQLIKERLEYLSTEWHAKDVRVSIFPDNIRSIKNVEAEGFVFVKKKILKPSGHLANIYKKVL